MSSERRPWFPWYPKDMVADEKVRGLSDDAELMYRRILDVLWQANDLQLPNICQKVANQVARGWQANRFENAWNELWTPGFEIFKTTDDGKRFYSERLLMEAQKIENISKKRSKLGKKGGQAKAKQKPSKSQAKAKQKCSHPDPDPDPDISKRTAPGGAAHFENKVGLYFRSIKSRCDNLKILSAKSNKNFNPFQWVQKQCNQRGHPGAIEETLSGIIGLWDTIENPWGYADTIMKTKNGNWNEQDAIAIHEELKSMKPIDLESLTGGILKKI